jgi:hypothetical protein
LLNTGIMPRDPKAAQDDDEELDLRDAPRVDEEEVEEDERALSSLSHKGDKHSEYGDEDDEDLVEDIDLDDLAAMEGPDA